MFIPVWALVCGVILLTVNFALDLYRFFRGRHHDHLLPNTPRSPRSPRG